MTNKSHIVDLLLDTAQGFYDIGFSCAAYLKSDEGRTVVQRTPVAAVNLSFAAELYLKAIHLLQRRKLHGHKLYNLFIDLSTKNKDEIVTLFNRNIVQNADAVLLSNFQIRVAKVTPGEVDEKVESSKDFYEFLQRHNQTFEEWRYLYEISEEGYHLHAEFRMLHCFIQALQEFIFNHKKGNDFIFYEV